MCSSSERSAASSQRPSSVRAVDAAFFLAGSARLLSLVTVGRPHTFALVLMVLEFVIPVVIVPWQAAVARASTAREHR